MDALVGAVTDFLGSGTISVVVKLALLLILGIGAIVIFAWLKKAEIAKARRDEDAKEVENKQELTKENKRENDEAKTDSKAVDDFLKGEGE